MKKIKKILENLKDEIDNKRQIIGAFKDMKNVIREIREKNKILLKKIKKKEFLLETKRPFGSPDMRFLFNDDVVKDSETALTWHRNANINHLCDYSDLKTIIEENNKSSFGGFNDWRLPSKNEFDSLLKYNKFLCGQNDTHFFVNKLMEIGFLNVFNTFFWTSTEVKNDSSKVWRCDLTELKFEPISKLRGQAHAWLVRGGKKS